MFIKKYLKYVITISLVLAAGLFLFLWNRDSNAVLIDENKNEAVGAVAEESPFRKELIVIEDGDTYGKVMERAGLDASSSAVIYEAAKDHYDFAKIRAGYQIEFFYKKDNEKLARIVYKPNTEEQLEIDINDDKYEAKFGPIPYETKIVTKEGEIKTSLYEAAAENNIDERAIIALADTLEWSIDFAMDPRVGDTFRFIYEEKYLDGEYVMPGKVLAGKYVNDGKVFYTFYFADGEEESSYYDENGVAAQKMFLKAPVAFKYISSGFTTGRRYVEAFNVSTGHRAVDYAAAAGTPIRSVGDGTITLAGWNGSYGNMVSVRHNGTYSTNYGHMSKIAIKRGAKVKQGDVIGYVGSTGFSTGPHLHYEMVKNGVKINPLLEIMPPGKPLNADLKAVFLEKTAAWREELDR